MSYPPPQAIKSIILCEECSNDSYTPKHKQLMATIGSIILPAKFGSYFVGRLQCLGCGTTEYGYRYRHELKALSPEETKLLKQTPLCEFTEYDKQLAGVYGINLSAKDERIKV